MFGGEVDIALKNPIKNSSVKTKNLVNKGKTTATVSAPAPEPDPVNPTVPAPAPETIRPDTTVTPKASVSTPLPDIKVTPGSPTESLDSPTSHTQQMVTRSGTVTPTAVSQTTPVKSTTSSVATPVTSTSDMQHSTPVNTHTTQSSAHTAAKKAVDQLESTLREYGHLRNPHDFSDFTLVRRYIDSVIAEVYSTVNPSKVPSVLRDRLKNFSDDWIKEAYPEKPGSNLNSFLLEMENNKHTFNVSPNLDYFNVLEARKKFARNFINDVFFLMQITFGYKILT